MTEREQALMNHCCRLQEHNRELREANANLRVERDAADVLLGAAMDELLAGSGRPRERS
jgi:hypothetical protein